MFCASVSGVERPGVLGIRVQAVWGLPVVSNVVPLFFLA